MNTSVVALKIKAALNVLARVEAIAPTLTKKQQREMPLASIAAAIRGLEIAMAELAGEAWPIAAAMPLSEDEAALLDELIGA